MIRSRTRSGTPGRPTPRRRRSSASLALATGGSFKIRWTVRCETRNCAAISLVECPASRRARTACRSSILSILLWPPLHENVGGRPKRRLQMPQDATEFREDRRQSLENPQADCQGAGPDAAEAQEEGGAAGPEGGEGGVALAYAPADGREVSQGHRGLLAADGGAGPSALRVEGSGCEERGGLLGLWRGTQRDVCLASHSARARSPGALWDRARRGGGADGPRGRVQWARAHKTRLRLRLHGEGALRGRAHLHTATVAERECGRGGVSPARRRGVLRVGALWGPGGVPREGDALAALLQLCAADQLQGRTYAVADRRSRPPRHPARGARLAPGPPRGRVPTPLQGGSRCTRA